MWVLPAHAGMVPSRQGRPPPGRGAPRARGDGPFAALPFRGCFVCSPRTRGWSLFDKAARARAAVLPAHAGMVPGPGGLRGAELRAPRARGDGPRRTVANPPWIACSPRTRGWSRRDRHNPPPPPVLPAHAGMVPALSRISAVSFCAPRARGDGPQDWMLLICLALCSPRTRGWSHRQEARPVQRLVLPAHAGMVPAIPSGAAPRGRAPRARGDGPRPAVWCWGRAVCSLPPARGDGPAGRRVFAGHTPCSPRTRGWSHHRHPDPGQGVVLPAHAGMVPDRWPPRKPPWCAPRARGDGPSTIGRPSSSSTCSPRTRGWSLAVGDGLVDDLVLPAHAGMVPSRGSLTPPDRVLPAHAGWSPPS